MTNKSSGFSALVSEKSLKIFPFSAAIEQQNVLVNIGSGDGDGSVLTSAIRLSLVASEFNLNSIKNIVWRQNYGTPVDVYQEDLNFIFTAVDSSLIKITAEVTLYIGEKYFTSILIKPRIDNPVSPSFCEGASDRLQINKEIHEGDYFDIYETQSNDLAFDYLTGGFLKYNNITDESYPLHINLALNSDIIIDYFGVIQNFGEETKKLSVERALNFNPPNLES